MHVGIITYQVPHLKTFQLLSKLLTKNRYRLTLYAFPFKWREPCEKRVFSDRPHQLIDYDVKAFCKRYDVNYVEMRGWKPEHSTAFGEPGAPDATDVFLHCTSKIVPPAFLKDRRILNCHPGLLPHNRGVDALKRCVTNQWPMGITLHEIDEEIDRGTIIYRMRYPIFETDKLQDVCQRAYDYEIDLLANFEHHLKNLSYNWKVSDEFELHHNLIPIDQDRRIEQIFLEHCSTLAALSQDLAVQPHPADQLLGAIPAPGQVVSMMSRQYAWEKA